MSIPVLKCAEKRTLEMRKNSNEKELERILKKNNGDGSIHSLNKDKLTKELDLQSYKDSFFSRFYKKEILELEKEIAVLSYDINILNSENEKAELLKDSIQRDQNKIDELSRKIVMEGYPGFFDDKAAGKYVKNFAKLSYPVTPQVPYINIVMIGETGAGKSSFLNTFATALSNSEVVLSTYRVSSEPNYQQSATKKLDLEPFYCGINKSRQLPIRFYDLPGISLENSIGMDELDMVMNGELKKDVTMAKAADMRRMESFLRKNPTNADKVHCILYVISASSNLVETSTIMKEIIRIRESRKSDDEVPQFAIVTHIDKIGVPNADMECAYHYREVPYIAKKVSKILDLPLCHVIPVSNYFEKQANSAKNAMVLMALWHVVSSGKDYIVRQLTKKIIHADF